MNVIVLDTETTGLDVEHAQILEIAIRDGIAPDGLTCVWRCRPTCPIDIEASETHGIYFVDVEHEKTFGEIAPMIRDALAGVDVIIGYRVDFDLDIVNAELARNGQQPIDFRRMLIVDPLALWSTFEPRKLERAHRRFAGSEMSNAHAAKADVDATARVLVGMMQAFGLAGRVGWSALASVADPHPDRGLWCGPSDHFVWRGDIVVANFGKIEGEDLYVLGKHHRGFLTWMQKRNFPPHVQRLVKGTLRAAKNNPPTSRTEFYAWVRMEFPPL